jgi:hypothetical protein
MSFTEPMTCWAPGVWRAPSLRVKPGAATTEWLYRKVIVSELRRGAAL